MFRGQIRGSRRETRSAINVDRLREILMLRSLDHDLFANIAKRVGYCTSGYVATEHVTHVLAA